LSGEAHNIAAFAREIAWREDHPCVSDGEQYPMIAAKALAHPGSRQWKG